MRLFLILMLLAAVLAGPLAAAEIGGITPQVSATFAATGGFRFAGPAGADDAPSC